MRKPVLRQNNKWGILSIATGLFAALPIICLPIGLREGMSPAMVVANANNRVNGVTNVETGEVVLEEWALVSSVDELSSGITENYEELPAGTDPVELSEDMSSIRDTTIPICQSNFWIPSSLHPTIQLTM